MGNQLRRPLGRPKKVANELTTNDKILFLATELFLDKGYTNVSMDDVAKYCNVTRATVYYYYKTKNDLFTEAMVQLMVRIKQQIIRILSTEEPLRFRLFKLAKAHIEATVDMDINAFMKEAKIALSLEQLRLMEISENEMYFALEQALQAEMNKGNIPKSNARLQSISFVALLTAGKKLEYEQDLEGLVNEILDLFWYGISSKE
ncbi:TetR/AcrR family transcriptional regulator [Lederbergia sp. NSJ-179]|uniref:TetR/AcrR family transcriptional regulator n=1 Tax=Lederbergia sp. NSJ-179 TaxID=2931402 RepID=UPI001FD18256|nr:TetR/AcrR family transcriptional regulator [Lederbergia sp. NSJ-179]MCJ7842802.1 TetR/AcrR family transcriptional regulator [Lederbergia sp. NSJ-179]